MTAHSCSLAVPELSLSPSRFLADIGNLIDGHLWLKMEYAENTGQVEQVEAEDLQPSAGEIRVKDSNLSASASNHVPASELGGQSLLLQTLQDDADSNDRSERAVNPEVHLLPEKAPSGEEAPPVTDVPSRLTISYSNGDSIAAPDFGADCSVHSASFHAGQMDTTLPRYESHQHTSPLMGHSEPVQSTAQQDEPDEEIPRIQAYAKLEFEDGEFYMNTYSVELGRDLEAARLAYEWEQDNSQFAHLKRRRTSTSSDEASQVSINTVREEERHNGRTVISDTGGILGPDAKESHIHKKPRLSQSKSVTPSSPRPSRNGSIEIQGAPRAGESSAMASLIDASTLPQADPEVCPLIRIHPPTTEGSGPANHRGISRRHVKIAFNFEKHVFELMILGRNGAFVEEVYHKEGETIALKNGSLIQIGGVRVRFLLPDMSAGEDNAAAADPFSNSPVESPVNLGFLNKQRLERELNKHGFTLNSSPYESSFVYSSSEENEPRGRQGEDDEAEGTEVEGEEAKDDEDDEDGAHMGGTQASSEPEELEAKPSSKSRRAKQNGKIKTTVKQAKKSGAKPSTKTATQAEDPSNSALVPEPTAPVVKRKGPGRPPKNGIMSKREQKLLAKQAQEAAKATEQPPSGEKVVDGNQDDTLAPPVPTKRKYTKRKMKDPHPQPGQDQGGENADHPHPRSPKQASEAQQKPPKEKKSARPPRTPSPVIDPATLSKEQLQRPNASYLQILHEVLSEAPSEGLGLPRIYTAIQYKYPYFKYVTATDGWQSSVRHNLSQHDIFKRTKREGKGWLWAVNPDVPFEKEKKRRAASPPRSVQHASHHPQMMVLPENYPPPHMIHGANQFPPPYSMPGHHEYPQPTIMQRPYHYPGVSIPNGHSVHNDIYPQYKPVGPMPFPPPGSSYQGVGPNGLPSSFLNHVADTSSTYESPYQSTAPVRPPDPPAQRPASEATLVNGFDGAHDPQTVDSAAPAPPRPPRAASETVTTQLNGPSPSPAPQTQPLGSALALTSNPSLEITQAIEQFKTNLINSMKDHQHGEALVNSAIHRVLGHQTSSSLPGNEEDPQEKTIMQVFSRMLDDLKKRSSQLQQPQPSQPPPSEPPNSQPQSGHVPVPAAISSSSSSSAPPQRQQQAPQPATEQQAIPAPESKD